MAFRLMNSRQAFSGARGRANSVSFVLSQSVAMCLQMLSFDRFTWICRVSLTESQVRETTEQKQQQQQQQQTAELYGSQVWVSKLESFVAKVRRFKLLKIHSSSIRLFTDLSNNKSYLQTAACRISRLDQFLFTMLRRWTNFLSELAY